MKIIFFGLGSIGRRYAKILIDKFNHSIFAYRSGKSENVTDTRIKEIHDWAAVENLGADIAFITNPTYLHIDTAIKCARLNMKLFIEKPMDCSSDKLDILIDEVVRRRLTSYIAYNLRFHPIIEFLKGYIKPEQVHHVSIYNSSYLPYWRPGSNHLDSYSASKEKGGGVILELSHEFDYIDYLFGEVELIEGAAGRITGLTVDAEDYVDCIVKTKNTNVNLHMDFFSMRPERSIKIDIDNESIYADLLNGLVAFHGSGGARIEKYKPGIEESYERQLTYFLQNINNHKMMNNVADASLLFRKILEFRKTKV